MQKCLQYKSYPQLKGSAWVKVDWRGFKAQFPATLNMDDNKKSLRIEGSNLLGEPQFSIFIKNYEDIIFTSNIAPTEQNKVNDLIRSFPKEILIDALRFHVPCTFDEKIITYSHQTQTDFLIETENGKNKSKYFYRFNKYLNGYWLQSLIINASSQGSDQKYSLDWGGAKNEIFIPQKFKISSKQGYLEVLWREVTVL